MASIIRVFIGDADADIIAQEQRMTNQTNLLMVKKAFKSKLLVGQ